MTAFTVDPKAAALCWPGYPDSPLPTPEQAREMFERPVVELPMAEVKRHRERIEGHIRDMGNVEPEGGGITHRHVVLTMAPIIVALVGLGLSFKGHSEPRRAPEKPRSIVTHRHKPLEASGGHYDLRPWTQGTVIHYTVSR